MIRLAPVLLLLLPPGHRPLPPATGEAVIRAAYSKYAGKWPTTITLVQRTRSATAQRPETWYESMKLPGKLRINIAPMGTGRAVIYRNDSSYGYGGARLRERSAVGNPMLLLSHDIHTQAPEKTIAAVKKLGIDLTKSYEMDMQGTKVIIVGAKKGDSLSNQFWLEKERMVLMRFVYNRAQVQIFAQGFKPIGGGWLESQVAIVNNGKIVQTEEYFDVKAGVPLEEALFEPGTYRLPKWVGGLEDRYGGTPAMPPQAIQRLQGRGGGGR